MVAVAETFRIPQDVWKKVEELQADYKEEEITLKGYVKRLRSLLDTHLMETDREEIAQLEKRLKDADITEGTYFKKLEKLLDSSLELAANNDKIATENKGKLQNIPSTKRKFSLFAYNESSQSGCNANAVTSKKIKVEETLESNGQGNNEELNVHEKEHEYNEEQKEDYESSGLEIKEEMNIDVEKHEINSQENDEKEMIEYYINGQAVKEEMIVEEEEHENNGKEMTEYHEMYSTKQRGEKEINTEDAGPSLPPRKETKASQPNEYDDAPTVVEGHQERVWSVEATLLLIETYRELQGGFSDNTMKKYQVWRRIAAALQAKGCGFDGNACDQKMRTLKRRYKAIKDSASLKGRGSAKQWQYYTAMDELMAKDPLVTPVTLSSSFPVAVGSELSSPLAVASPEMPTPTVWSSLFTGSPPSSPSPTSSTHSDGLSTRPRTKKRKNVGLSLVGLIEKQESTLKSLASGDRLTKLQEILTSLKETPTDPPSGEGNHQLIMDLQQKFLEVTDRYNKVTEKYNSDIIKMQQDHTAQMLQLTQSHREEINKVHMHYARELKEQEERFLKFMSQQQQPK